MTCEERGQATNPQAGRQRANRLVRDPGRLGYQAKLAPLNQRSNRLTCGRLSTVPVGFRPTDAAVAGVRSNHQVSDMLVF